MIAVIFALPDESRDFCRGLTGRRAHGRGAAQVVEGRLGERAIMVIHTGIGAAAARRRTQELLGAHRPRLAISAGFAGGLQADLRVGDVVVDLREAADATRFQPAPRCRLGKMATVPRALETAAEKAELGRASGALAVEMETGIIAEVCRGFETPLIAVRSISDTVSQTLPVPLEFWFDLERQQPRIAGLLWYLALHPSRIRPFAHFVAGLGAARAALAETLCRVIEGTSPP